MKQLLISTLAGVSLTLASGAVHAGQVTVTTELARFHGPRAYVAVYLTDPNGAVVDTLHIAGRDAKYYRHLRDWARGAQSSKTRPHTVTGASAGSGTTLRVSADIADSMIAAGYQIRVDASIEDVGDYPRSAILTLGKESAVNGRGVVRTLRVD